MDPHLRIQIFLLDEDPSADPDPTFHSDADPDPTFHSDADPDPYPDPSFKKGSTPGKNSKIGSYSIHFGLTSAN